jgi:G2/mitotic-specific cyclin 1/2
LGEVTALANNRNKAQPGKGKEKEGAIKKEKLETAAGKSTTVRTTRQPLRTVAGTRHNANVTEDSEVLVDVKEEPRLEAHDENAMAIDLPPQPALPSVAIRKSLVSRENTSVAARHSDAAQRRTSTRSSIPVPQRQPQLDDEDEEVNRAYKRRRTSEAPEDAEDDPEVLEQTRLLEEEELITARIAAELEAYANDEPEADPETSPWDDLDADDVDDPVMVSEYVVDIFNYLKQVEVRVV